MYILMRQYRQIDLTNQPFIIKKKAQINGTTTTLLYKSARASARRFALITEIVI